MPETEHSVCVCIRLFCRLRTVCCPDGKSGVKKMNDSLEITISKHKPKRNKGITTVRKTKVREKLLRLLLGEPVSVTVIVPGKTVTEMTIREERNEDYEAL